VRVVIVAGNFVKTGGMDRANYALASHLAGRGVETHLVAHSASDALVRRSNVKFHWVPRPINSVLVSDLLLDRVGRYWARRISERGGRVVVNGSNCRWLDVNWVHYVHAAYLPDTEDRAIARLKSRISHSVFRRLERAILSGARLVLANSRRTRDDVIARFGLSESAVRTIYCGIDASIFYPAPAHERAETRAGLGLAGPRYLAAFIGGLTDRRKGFDAAVQAWSKLCKDPGWDVDLVVLGTGAELPRWRARLKYLALEPRVHLLGFRSDAPAILRACDALVAPTRYEPYGLAVQEALCCGVPAFVSQDSGVAERFPAALRGLLLRNPADANDLAQRLRAWRADVGDYRAAIAPLADALRRYSWENMAADISTTMGLAA
jgi:glycosyltransferase involved in cell wall biosynthesis